MYTQSVGLLGRGDQPVTGRYLHIDQHKHTINAHRYLSMPWVTFEPTTPVFERANTVHALDRAATVIGTPLLQILNHFLHNPLEDSGTCDEFLYACIVEICRQSLEQVCNWLIRCYSCVCHPKTSSRAWTSENYLGSGPDCREDGKKSQAFCVFKNRITVRTSLPYSFLHTVTKQKEIKASFTWLLNKRLLRPVIVEMVQFVDLRKCYAQTFFTF
jgi:hypothetical protein